MKFLRIIKYFESKKLLKCLCLRNMVYATLTMVVLIFSAFDMVKSSQTWKFEARKKKLETNSFESINNKFKKSKDKDDFSKYNNINHGFPDMMQAPTSPDSFTKGFNFTAPPLSRALFENDPQRKVKLHDFLQEVRFPLYNMTRGEAQQIFYFADKDKDELISQHEWDDFAEFFIYPFEACDEDFDYLLNEKEFKKCYEFDPISKFINYKKERKNDWYLVLMDSITTRSKEIINFADYLLFKRAAFGWKECESASTYMSKESFVCAIRLAIPVRYHLNFDIKRFYDAGLNLMNNPAQIQLDFPSYLRTIYYSYVFVTFSSPRNLPYLGKADFLKAIRDDRIPQNFNEKDVETLYQLTDNYPVNARVEMNIETWFFFFNLHRLFNKYSIERPLQIVESELVKLINDTFFPIKIAHSIDNSVANLTEHIYLEASLILDQFKTSEKDFFYKFKETSSVTEKISENFKFKKLSENTKQDASALSASFWNQTTGDYYTWHRNENLRKYFFRMATNNNKQTWTRDIYFKVMQLANLFTFLTTDVTFLVPVTKFNEELYKSYDLVNPPISQIQRTNFALYKALPRDVRMDLFCFLYLELWKSKFDDTKGYSNRYIDETDLRIVMNDYGMKRMPDTVIDNAKKGYDRLRRRIFEPKKVIINLITVQAVGGELVRTQNKIEKYKLKGNDDWSRKYPSWQRRLHSSPRI